MVLLWEKMAVHASKRRPERARREQERAAVLLEYGDQRQQLAAISNRT
jgi:hypothetical protein